MSSNLRGPATLSASRRCHSADMLMLNWIDDDDPLPPTRRALGPDSDAPGLLAAGGSLDAAAPGRGLPPGVFPWYSDGQPVLWWSPDPRMVLPVAEFKLSRSLRKTLRRFVAHAGLRGAHRQRLRARHRRLRAARRARARTAPGSCREMVARLQRTGTTLGRVHSFETWIDGELVGGLYGVSHRPHVLRRIDVLACAPTRRRSRWPRWCAFCRAHGIALIDCQQHTGHLASLGAREIAARRVRAPPRPAPGRSRRSPIGPMIPRMWRQLGTAAAPRPEEHRPVTHPKELPLSSLQFYATAPYPCSYLPDRHGALAGGHAQPPDPRRRLLRAWWPTASGAAACSPTGPIATAAAPACRCACRWQRFKPTRSQRRAWKAHTAPAGARAAPVLRARALPALPALPGRAATAAAAWTTTASTSTPSSCCKAASTRAWWSSASRRPTAAGRAEDGVDPRRAERRPVGRLHLLRARAARQLRHLQRAVADRADAAAQAAARLPRLLDRRRARRWPTRRSSGRTRCWWTGSG